MRRRYYFHLHPPLLNGNYTMRRTLLLLSLFFQLDNIIGITTATTTLLRASHHLLTDQSSKTFSSTSESESESSADPYSHYFYTDIHGKTKKGGQTLHRARKDIRGYTPEARYNYDRWRNGPPNTYGKTWVHSCVSFPFCNHIPPPPAFTPGPWDIPAPTPNPTYPTLHPFPKMLYGEKNFYGRDMYQYKFGMPYYKKSDEFFK